MLKKIVLMGGVGLLLATSALVIGSGSAEAHPPGTLTVSQYFILNYHSHSYGAAGCDEAGATKAFWDDDKDLGNDHFGSESAYPCSSADEQSNDGYGQVIKNNAGSALNRSGYHVRVYYNTYSYMGNCWCGGVYDSVLAGRDELSSTQNEDASLYFTQTAN